MPGLHKAWVFVCAMVVSAWPWSSPVWYQGKLWKRHEPTGWWAEVNLNGELAQEDDWDGFLEHGFEVPLANKRRKKNPLQSIDEEEEGGGQALLFFHCPFRVACTRQKPGQLSG